MSNLKKQLAGANKLWAQAKKKAAESRPSASLFEDGKYLVRLMGGEITESNSGRQQLVWKWKFMEEPYEGKVKQSFQGMETVDNLMYLHRDLEKLGYESPDDLAGVLEILEDIAKRKPVARVTLKTKDGSDFQNVYINRVMDEEGEAEEEAAEEETEETEETEEEAADEESEEETEEEEEEAEAEEDEEAEEEEVEEEAEEEAEEEEVAVEVGMSVIANTKSGPKPGTIVEILEDEGKLVVKTADGKVKLSVDKVEFATEPEPKVEPKKKAAKAEPAPAPAKKKAAPAPAKKKR